jgi:uracil-DNA glycosylase
MGIVPWVVRNSTSVSVALSDASVAIISEAATVTETALVDSTAELPADLAELSAVLPNKAIAAFNVRGSWQNFSGSRDASVLVVVLPPTDGAAMTEMPLSNQEAQLFEQMLRAIGLTRKDILQCVLQTASKDAVAGSGEAAGAMESVTVETLSGGSVRAVLLLQSDIGKSEIAGEHRFAFGSASIPAWRLPHPAQLLSEPIRKRQAWQILKAVRRVLAADS